MTESEEMQELVSPAEEPDGNVTWRELATRLRQAPRRLWRQRPYLTIGFAIFLVVNLLLLAGYLWSYGGATTTVRIEARGSQYRAFVDNTLIAEGTLQGARQGGIGFQFAKNDAIPSLPQPAGVDSVRVTDLNTGAVIFEDGFGRLREDRWSTESGDWHIQNGVLTTAIGGLVTTGAQPWEDYVLEAKLRNVTDATVYVRVEESRNAVVFRIRPFRHYDSSLGRIEDGQEVEHINGGGLHLDRGQTIRSLAAMLLRPYPTALLLIVGVIALAVLVRVTWAEKTLLAAGRLVRNEATWLALGLGLGALVLLWYVNYVVGEAIPHVPDSVLYVFQSKIFASFKITADAPPVRESFSIFHPHMLQVADGRWFSHYPFGHPLFLAVGQLFGAVWLVPPMLGAASVVLIYWVGKHVYGAAVGLIAAVLLFFSPFFQMTAGNFMSHNTAAFTILATLFLMVLPTKRRMLAMFFSGVFLGLLFNIRPLTAVAFIPVLGVLMGYELLRAGPNRAQRFREGLAFGAGGLLLLLAYFLYNDATTGSFTQSPYQLQGTFTSDTFGFGGGHSVAIGLQNQQVWLAFMLLVANGWPAAVGLFFAVLPFVLGSRHRWDYFLAAAFLAIASSTIFYRNAAVMHGPRFWYEALPFLILLTARGVHFLTELAPAVGDWLAARLHWRPSVGSAGITGVVVYSLVVALVAVSAYGWMLGKRDAWPAIAFVPQKISELEGFNFTDRRLLDRAEELDLENALVLVENCPQWWCYGSVFWANSPGLDGEVVWAELQRTEDDVALLEHFQDRDLYLADHGSGSIRPVTEAQIVGSIEVPDIAMLTPTPQTPPPPTPTPDLAAVARRDEQRRQDLETLAVALQEYYARNGSYPLAVGLQSFCRYRTLDAGCKVIEVLDPIPQDPSPPGTYWYRSDGTTFTLFAQTEGPAGPPSCPEPLPAPLRDADTTYCLQGNPAAPP